MAKWCICMPAALPHLNKRFVKSCILYGGRSQFNNLRKIPSWNSIQLILFFGTCSESPPSDEHPPSECQQSTALLVVTSFSPTNHPPPLLLLPRNPFDSISVDSFELNVSVNAFEDACEKFRNHFWIGSLYRRIISTFGERLWFRFFYFETCILTFSIAEKKRADLKCVIECAEKVLIWQDR